MLPRFTAGKLGNLDFSHLNETFDYVEGKKGNVHDDPVRPTEMMPLIVAEIGTADTTNGNHAWKEVVLDQNGQNWSVLSDGRVSGYGAIPSTWKFPARTIDGSIVASGSKAVLVPKRRKTGELFYLIITTEPPGTFPYRIVASTEIVAGRRWRYTVIQQNWNPPTGTAIDGSFSDKDQIARYMWNSVEYLQDNGPPTSIYGVGMKPPTYTQVTRRPLRNELVVMATKMANNSILCCVPNGYGVNCTTP